MEGVRKLFYQGEIFLIVLEAHFDLRPLLFQTCPATPITDDLNGLANATFSWKTFYGQIAFSTTNSPEIVLNKPIQVIPIDIH